MWSKYSTQIDDNRHFWFTSGKTSDKKLPKKAQLLTDIYQQKKEFEKKYLTLHVNFCIFKMTFGFRVVILCFKKDAYSRTKDNCPSKNRWTRKWKFRIALSFIFQVVSCKMGIYRNIGKKRIFWLIKTKNKIKFEIEIAKSW